LSSMFLSVIFLCAFDAIARNYDTAQSPASALI
jgi:hypothetical protein